MRRPYPMILLGTAALSLCAAPALAASGALNPAVTQATIHQTICVAGYTDSIRPPSSFTDALKAQQIQALALSGPLGAFEEDHIIPLELGGAPRDPANLQPVPLAVARRDDVLETRLHNAVCAGTLSLDAAQAQILAAKAGEGAAVAMPGGAVPSGPAKAGDGASLQGVNTTEIAGGSAILAAAAATGIAALRRRRAGARP